MDFEDSQASLYLLRVSYSIVRAVHFMRTTPLHQWLKQSTEFDEMVRDAACSILGHPLNERAFTQAALTPKLGGLGLRKSTEHAGFAYSASWHEARVQAGEVWVKPDQVSEVHKAQSDASYEFDGSMHSYLVDSAPNDREKQRLLRVARPHAGSFVTAVPSEEDGNDCLMKPRQYRVAVAYRLGLPVLKNEIPCPLCMQTINVYGDHATCCAKNGDLVVRHNALRNFVHSVASDGLLQPQLEKQGILGPTTGRRPGDVTIPDWKHGNGLAIDVAVTSPLTKTSVRLVDPCEDYSERSKHQKYDASFEGSNYYFCAMVFETLGGVNEQGEKVLRQLFTFAAKKLGREFSSYCSRAWGRVSCCLQRSVAQVILNRIDGVSDEAELPGQSFAVATGVELSVGRCSIGESVGVLHESGGPSVSALPRKDAVDPEPEPNQGFCFGERPRECANERREGRGGGIMNTSHISTIRAHAVSCKQTIGREGPGRNKNVSTLTAGNSYIPNTSPPREKRSSHASHSCSNTVKNFPHTRQHTPPSKPTGGTPLLAGTSPIASPVKVLASPGLKSRSRGPKKPFPGAPRAARGAFASRGPSVGYYNEAVAKFCKDPDEGLAQSKPEGQTKES